MPETSTQASKKTGLNRVHQSLVVPVSAKIMRVGVRDRTNDRIGTLELPLPITPEPVRPAATAAH